MPANHGLDRGRSKGVEYLVDLRAGDPENILDALSLKGFDHYLSARLCSL
jgi:hypothetical protein